MSAVGAATVTGLTTILIASSEYFPSVCDSLARQTHLLPIARPYIDNANDRFIRSYAVVRQRRRWCQHTKKFDAITGAASLWSEWTEGNLRSAVAADCFAPASLDQLVA